MKHGRPTILHVAQDAAVSVVTVSRFLNQPSVVAEPTRRKIEQAMDRLGYVPNVTAQSLSSHRTRLVACVVPTLVSSIFEETIRGLADTLRIHGYSLLIGSTDYVAEREAELTRTGLGRRVDGLVLTGDVLSPPLRALLAAAETPVVEIWSLPPEPIDMACGFDNAAAARAMVRHLVARGYRRIAYAGRGAADNSRAAGRRTGYAAGLAEAGLPLDPALVLDCPNTMQAGQTVMNTLRPRLPGIDAVMFSSDNLAAGAWFACQTLGLAIPSDLAIAGFGGTDLAACIPGGLTTIDVHGHGIGCGAARLLLDRWSARPAPPRIDTGFDLIPRAST